MVGFKATDVPPTATVKFLGAGTAACIADLITFPLDTAKVRLQIQGESQGLARTAASAQYRGVLGTILTMVRTEGPRSLYNGLVAGLQRQMSFASVRIGLYDSVKQFYTKGSEHAGIGSRLLAGSTTGALAVAVAQPTDVVKVRFQAQARAGGGRRYQSTVEAYKTIAREEEGPRAFYKGFMPSFLRLGSWNVVMFVTYEQLKRALMAAYESREAPF
ncbi:uncoupling protein 2 (mitochondrial, proton carrier), isoform CRA_b [Rattus norvegicus]|uniref:Uncoupling protein 2 (Mitochondrial, proton carrier), isoform CRA_b n=1 Tax=Rattus norvegicus TaxID=10116 RepID=A6I6P3_RAT|nr:uncoupling protein 2 (mitochondrial, proton carrier), isoform CRA_b [Rattus norvegicus]